MLNPKKCLRLIEAANDCASNPESAYLMRSRLLRAVLSVAHLLASRNNLPSPDSPDYISKIETICANEDLEAAKAANHVLALARQLCQPSEALDARWKTGWSEMQPALKILELKVKILI